MQYDGNLVVAVGEVKVTEDAMHARAVGGGQDTRQPGGEDVPRIAVGGVDPRRIDLAIVEGAKLVAPRARFEHDVRSGQAAEHPFEAARFRRTMHIRRGRRAPRRDQGGEKNSGGRVSFLSRGSSPRLRSVCVKGASRLFSMPAVAATAGPPPSIDTPSLVWLCIGGCWFVTTRDTLDKYRDSNLAHARDGEFIDRDPAQFRYVLNYLRGSRVLPECRETLAELAEEADYYNLGGLVTRVRDALRRAPPTLATSVHLLTTRVSL